MECLTSTNYEHEHGWRTVPMLDTVVVFAIIVHRGVAQLV